MSGNFYKSTFICPECGKPFYVQRPKKKKRANGHIKTMFCAYCGDMRDFVEMGEHYRNGDNAALMEVEIERENAV